MIQSQSKVSVKRDLPSGAINFNCPIFSDSSGCFAFSFDFKSDRYFLGRSLPDIIQTI
jgi:hypothetical protein